MKATGIVRRIDDLGRVVIPKEIRRTMRIREGDPLEIYTDREGEVIFKKYSPVGEMNSFAAQYADTLNKTCDLLILICDRDAVIAGAGLPRRDFADRKVSLALETLMTERTQYSASPNSAAVEAIEGDTTHFVSCASPIVSEGDVIGCVASLVPMSNKQTHRVTELEQKLIQTAAGFLGRQLEG